MPEASFARRLAEGFSLPGVVFAIVAGTGVGALQHRINRPLAEPAPTPTPTPVGPPHAVSPPLTPIGGALTGRPDRPLQDPTLVATATSQPEGPQPEGPQVTAAEVRAAIQDGKLEEALEKAQALGEGPLLERAHLLWSLTRSIPASPLADVGELVAVTTQGGRRVVGTVVDEADGVQTFATVGGERQQVRTGEISERRTFSGDAIAREKAKTLRDARKKLGREASGLALHRLALLAFAVGCPAEGVTLLEEALVGPDGEIVVDTFGEGNLTRLLRARRALAGQPEPEPEPARPEPRPEPTPVEPEPVEEPWPATTAAPSDPNGPDPLFSDPGWLEADASYKTGLALFRETFGGNADDLILRAAQREFTKALESLNRIAPKYPEHYELEHRMQELAKLSVDCMKRQRVD